MATTFLTQPASGTITIKASFAVYAADGSKISRKELEKQAVTLEKNIKGAWTSDSFERNGITYTVSVDVEAKAYKNEASAEAAGADNLVGIIDTDYLDTPDGRLAGGYAGHLSGENFDRVLVARGELSRTDVYAHEFTHLLGNTDIDTPNIISNTNPRERSSKASSLDYDRTFGRQITAVRALNRATGNSTTIRRLYIAPELSRDWFK